MDTFQLLTPRGQGGAPAAGGFSQTSGYQANSFNGMQQNSAPSYDAGMAEEDVDLPF
jgi:single-strand DNA-binding protein